VRIGAKYSVAALGGVGRELAVDGVSAAVRPMLTFDNLRLTTNYVASTTAGAVRAASGYVKNNNNNDGLQPAPPPSFHCSKHELYCVICQHATPNQLFEPCSHLACCENCAKIWTDNKPNAKCPLCRTQIENTRTVYVPITTTTTP
jgi:hypothetical protein